MGTIKLKYEEVMKTLEEVKNALDAVSMDSPAAGSLGQNSLDYTTKWLDREENIHKAVQQYMEVVKKNLEDTRANVELLKEQDEAMVKK
ncbi:hypothetical protein ELQ35_07420 [Peribacillus cavernae]|uniref:YwqI/YxiC family protein n=1 Tax=Peribacillus cavernae TaxID=1674310 RepID=A0A433HPD5_9BACI|nr:YwqI/YxiC family protein [Peribacillus cavernae]MDQ0217382.1 hypothetical protein [Peribacillus cavernae]RUQ30169.1 hypothetical protein ELQ35_07420 [Peribacillus cavernae]